MRQFRRLGGQLATSTARAGADDAKGRAERAEELASLTWDRVQREKVAVGTPEMVVERIQEMKEALQLSGIVAEFNAGELLPPEAVARSLRLFCERVVPAFR